jgi:hypothetical protein
MLNKEQKMALVLEQVLQAAVENGREAARKGDAFNQGSAFAYYGLLSIALENAEVLELGPSEIGMLDFDPDQELLPGQRRDAA